MITVSTVCDWHPWTGLTGTALVGDVFLCRDCQAIARREGKGK